jgi:hypothetical protein
MMMTTEVILVASDGAADDEFGYSVSIDGDYAIIGARYDDDNGGNSGAQVQIGRSRRSCLLQTKQPVTILAILFQSMETMQS